MSDNLTKVDFNGLILGFSSAALYYIGHSAIDGKSAGEKNLPLAQQNIHIIEILQEKTKGNLSAEEAKLLEEVLHDLRLKFVSAQNEEQSRRQHF
jgi:hypothetical protein